MKKAIRVVCYTAFILLAAGYVLFPTQKENYHIKYGYRWEAYDPALSYRLKSVDNIIQYTDSVIGKDKRGSLDYVRSINRTISSCFYHGYSHYSFRHNWIAYVSSKLIWPDLNAIVDPHDLLQHPSAACSQVCIVLAACLKKIDVPYRKVGLVGHFVLEANVGKRWYLFDPNLEPIFKHGRKSVAELIKANELDEAYAGRHTKAQIEHFFSKIQYGQVNAELAPHALAFQRTTFILSILIGLSLIIYVVADFSKALYSLLLRWALSTQQLGTVKEIGSPASILKQELV